MHPSQWAEGAKIISREGIVIALGVRADRDRVSGWYVGGGAVCFIKDTTLAQDWMLLQDALSILFPSPPIWSLVILKECPVCWVQVDRPCVRRSGGAYPLTRPTHLRRLLVSLNGRPIPEEARC